MIGNCRVGEGMEPAGGRIISDLLVQASASNLSYQARKSLSWSRGSLETAFSMSSSVLAIVDVSCG